MIRLATEADIAALMQLIRRVIPFMHATGNFQWNEHYPNEDVFKQDILNKQLWVAEMQDTIAGVAALTMDQSPEYADVGWDLNEPAIVTHRLAVDPDFRGKGIAIALLQKAEEIAAELDITILRIDTNTENKATQQLFPKLGYKFAGEIGLNFRPGLRFYCYEKRLNPKR